MRRTLSILIFATLAGCTLRTKPLDMDKIREDFAKEAKTSNARILAWEKLVDSLYKMADTNRSASLHAIDNIISNDNFLDRQKVSELHFIKGDIYYRVDSLKQSVSEFIAATNRYDLESPKILAARAGAYIKLEQYDKALADLNRAAEINYDYFWNLGNYYEVIGNRDSALSCYNRLYNHNTTTYRFCQDRVSALKNPKTKLFTELFYRDRERIVILFNGGK